MGFAFHLEGWSRDYFSDLRNYVDHLRILTGGCVWCFLVARGESAMQGTGFHIVFAICTYYKYTKILYCLTPFRNFGLSILPIVHAMRDIGAFLTVMLCHIFGLWHAYVSLGILGYDAFQSYLLVYRYGILADFDLNELDGSLVGLGSEYHYVMRIFFVVSSFGIT